MSDWNRPTHEEILAYKRLFNLAKRFAPADDDDPRSAGHCLKHGNYNGRLLSCPMCARIAGRDKEEQ